jgi:hypothetical protein
MTSGVRGFPLSLRFIHYVGRAAGIEPKFAVLPSF